MRGYKRGQKHVRNLRLYEVHKNGRTYWRLRTPDPGGTGFSERQFVNEAQAQGAFNLAYIQYTNHGLKAGSLGQILQLAPHQHPGQQTGQRCCRGVAQNKETGRAFPSLHQRSP
jgi:hypothetical protein